MRESLAIALFAVLGAAGCGDASADIQAAEHGKRLNLVAGDNADDAAGSSSPQSGSVETPLPPHAAAASASFRDVAGFVLTDAKTQAQQLTQWLLNEDGDQLLTRTCPVKAAGGVNFGDCRRWSRPVAIAEIGLSAPIRSFSSYLFAQTSQTTLVQVAFNMAGNERLERTCRVNGGEVAWASCSNWIALEESAAGLGVPQQTAFDDEVVVPYVDDDGIASFTQQLIASSGESVWSRTCSTAAGEVPGVGGACAFLPAVRISAIGIHFDAVQGVGGYTYTDGASSIYAQTVVAANGIDASRRLCPVTTHGVAFEKCLGWETVTLADLSQQGAAL